LLPEPSVAGRVLPCWSEALGVYLEQLRSISVSKRRISERLRTVALGEGTAPAYRDNGWAV
jgi:hypothetical protein